MRGHNDAPTTPFTGFTAGARSDVLLASCIFVLRTSLFRSSFIPETKSPRRPCGRSGDEKAIFPVVPPWFGIARLTTHPPGALGLRLNHGATRQGLRSIAFRQVANLSYRPSPLRLRGEFGGHLYRLAPPDGSLQEAATPTTPLHRLCPRFSKNRNARALPKHQRIFSSASRHRQAKTQSAVPPPVLLPNSGDPPQDQTAADGGFRLPDCRIPHLRRQGRALPEASNGSLSHSADSLASCGNSVALPTSAHVIMDRCAVPFGNKLHRCLAGHINRTTAQRACPGGT